jgi:hypothetical protein
MLPAKVIVRSRQNICWFERTSEGRPLYPLPRNCIRVLLAWKECITILINLDRIYLSIWLCRLKRFCDFMVGNILVAESCWQMTLVIHISPVILEHLHALYLGALFILFTLHGAWLHIPFAHICGKIYILVYHYFVWRISIYCSKRKTKDLFPSAWKFRYVFLSILSIETDTDDIFYVLYQRYYKVHDVDNSAAGYLICRIFPDNLRSCSIEKDWYTSQEKWRVTAIRSRQ